jgi:hypothetical protein
VRGYDTRQGQADRIEVLPKFRRPLRRDGEETPATDLPSSARRQSLGAGGRDIADDIERANSETDHSDKSC